MLLVETVIPVDGGRSLVTLKLVELLVTILDVTLLITTYNAPYSRVCGMVVGYQKGSTDAFAVVNFSTRSIDDPYVDGVSITYNTPRKHIWTYGIGFSEKANHLPSILVTVHVLSILVDCHHLLFMIIIIMNLGV